MPPFAKAVISSTFIASSILFSVSPSSAQDTCSSSNRTVSSDSFTKSCSDAYCALPKQDRLFVVEANDFVTHVLANKKSYQTYLDNCFVPWNDGRPDTQLHPETKDFLMDTFGALFYKNNGKISFVCSAFRVSTDLIATARHCVYPDTTVRRSVENFIFRLISQPAVDIPVTGEVPNAVDTPFGVIANDFDDYWFLRLSGNYPSFSKTRAEFRSALVNFKGVLVGGVNSVAFVLNGSDPENWLSSYRFTRVAGSQWFPGSKLSPPSSAEASARCIYYKAPTFPGLSGSPILGVDYVPTSHEKPKLFVVGIHLRSGAASLGHEFDSNCGSYMDYNVGIALPADLIEKVNPH
jgi:V8-like Glu-specific endopeptidase